MVKFKNKNLILWFVPISAELKQISKEEYAWKNELSHPRAREFHHSRGYVREVLANIWDIKALEIPLSSPPGKPPRLPNGMGYLSFSHCIDGLLIGWSKKKLGVDIERADRSFEAKKILNKVFSKKEQKIFKNINSENYQRFFLRHWVRKEAAIKWGNGSIARDITKWIYDANMKMIFNKEKNLGIHSFFIEYNFWYISICCDEDPAKSYPIICHY